MAFLSSNSKDAKLSLDEIARGISNMRYEELLKMGEQLKTVVGDNKTALADLQPHDWVALVHAWSKVALEKPVLETNVMPFSIGTGSSIRDEPN